MRDIVEQLRNTPAVNNETLAARFVMDEAAAEILSLRQQVEKARAQGRDEGLEEALDLLTAHELYRYRPKAFVGFIDYVRALKSGEGV